MRTSRYTREMLAAAVAASNSISGAMRLLGIRLAGGSHAYIAKRVRTLGIDTTHFPGKHFDHGFRKRATAEILVKRSGNGSRTPARFLRRSLLDSGVPYKCAAPKCGAADTWLGKPLRLQVEHKNGDSLDNRLENLEFLCPNCHSQTATWGRVAKPKKRAKVARATKIVWPSDAELKSLIWAQPATSVASSFGLSASAIKKRCNERGIPTPPRGYWAKLKAAESKALVHSPGSYNG